MLSNYFTLYHVAAELHRRFERSVVAQIFTQEKNTLSILLYTPDPHTITITCTPRENSIIVKNGDARSRKNTVDRFPELIDNHLQSVYLSTNDRTVYFQFHEHRWLCADMFDAKANIVLCSKEGTVLNAFLKNKELLSTVRPLQYSGEPITLDRIVPPRSQFVGQLSSEGKKSSGSNTRDDLRKALKKCLPRLGSLLADEILYRAAQRDSGNMVIDGDNIYQRTVDVVSTLLDSSKISPCIYFEETSPVCFSLMPLDHLSVYRREPMPDLLTGMQKFISLEQSVSTHLHRKKEVISWLTKEHAKLERTIRLVEADLKDASRAEQYELFANVLMANLSVPMKGMNPVTLNNPFNENVPISIPMDLSLSPQKNAEKYYEKAKKSKSSRVETQVRLDHLHKREVIVSDLLEKSNNINDSISLKKFLQSYGGMVKELGFMTEKEQEELPPFKSFVVEGGFTVYAGKNSSNNDLLTFRFAKPNDLWFHARGSSGSHVVLKVGSAQGAPSKKAIEQAAAIAAYYSKMKNAKHVPVAMTQRKYLRKPKGAPAGTVALDKEKVIFVQPVLPEENA